MGADIGSANFICVIGAPEEADIVELQYQEHDPVDACNDGIQTEWGGAARVLAPDGAARVVVGTVVRATEAIVGACDNHEEPTPMEVN